MSSNTLTRNEALLIQRYYDGECGGDERDTASELLERSTAARVYLAALESLGEATRLAERQAWESASLSSPEQWLELAESSREMSEAPLEELAPLLERFYDGEVDDAEVAIVRALSEQRDDVDDYLGELDRLGDCVRSADPADDVDFDDLWEGIEEGIDEFEHSGGADPPVAVEAFDPEEHHQLLMRYHDGEATDRQRRRVETWLEGGDERVEEALAALDEIDTGVRAGVETAVERGEPDEISTRIAPHLDAVDAERAADNVVSLRSESGGASSGPGWMRPLAALAAAVVLLATGALFGPELVEPDSTQPGAADSRIAENGESDGEPPVVFDTVEPAPGSSVFIHSPEFADHDGDDTFGLGPDVEPMSDELGLDSEHEELDPTVLWIVQDDDEDEDDEDDEEDDEDESDELPGPI